MHTVNNLMNIIFQQELILQNYLLLIDIYDQVQLFLYR